MLMNLLELIKVDISDRDLFVYFVYHKGKIMYD